MLFNIEMCRGPATEILSATACSLPSFHPRPDGCGDYALLRQRPKVTCVRQLTEDEEKISLEEVEKLEVRLVAANGLGVVSEMGNIRVNLLCNPKPFANHKH